MGHISGHREKHLGLISDFKLDYNEHVDKKINKCNEIKGIMKRLSLILSRKSLLTACNRPNLHYSNIIYNK